MAIIDVQGMHYEYPQTVAVDNVSFQLEAGTVTALVGPNGAGKTTLMNCLISLMRAQRGQIFIDGISVFDEPRKIHQIVGYLPDYFGLYDELTSYQCLLYHAMAHKIPTQNIEKAIELAANRAEIMNYMETKAGMLSRGQRQRLAIAQSILHEPKVLLLDEPAAGLDPEARHHLSRLIVELAQSGMTLLVSSHILAELEEYSTHLIILRKGKILEFSEIKSARTELATHRYIELTLAHSVDNLSALLVKLDNINDIQLEGLTATFEFHGNSQAQASLLKQLLALDLPISSFAPKSMRLQEAYLKKIAETK